MSTGQNDETILSEIYRRSQMDYANSQNQNEPQYDSILKAIIIPTHPET